MAKAKVAVLKTHPETVVEDYKKLMRMADYDKCLAKEKKICLKINVSWQIFYPGCSTTPWQLEGVIQTLLEDGVPTVFHHLTGTDNPVDISVGQLHNSGHFSGNNAFCMTGGCSKKNGCDCQGNLFNHLFFPPS